MEDEVVVTPASEPIAEPTQTVEPVVEQEPTVIEPSIDTTPVVEEPQIDTSQTPAEVTAIVEETVDPYDEAIEYIENTRAQNELLNGNPLEDWLNTSYDYDRSQQGKQWVAGKINDVKTQMGFLEALLNEQLYGEMDLQKYYFDQNLATARAYAKEKQSETAYGFYRAAQEKALAEGQLTGWYMPAEANYLLGQWTIAKENLKDPNIDDYERNRAANVARMAESWFAHNNITTRGIECLNKLYLEENIRHNKMTEELQRQANDIAMQQARAGAAGVALQLRELEFQYGQMELAYGADITGDGVIGHAREEWKSLGSFEDQYNWVDQNFDIAWITLGKNSVEHILGDNYQKSYDNYLGRQGNNVLKDSLDANGFLDESGLTKQSYTLPNKGEYSGLKDRNIYTFNTTDKEGNASTRAYYKDNLGKIHQITDSNVKLSDGKILSDKLTSNFASTALKDIEGNIVQVGNAKDISTFDSSFSNNADAYEHLSDKTKASIKEYEAAGYKVKWGYYSTDKINADIVMEWTGAEGTEPKGKYIEVSNVYGDVKTVPENKVKAVKINNNNFSSNSEAYNQSMKIGNDSNGNEVVMITDSKGNQRYFVGDDYYYSDMGPGKIIYNEISFEEASKYNKNLSDLTESAELYNSVDSNTTYESVIVKNAEARVEELSGANKDKEMKGSIKSKSSGGGGGASGGTTTPQSSKGDKDKISVEKTEVKLREAEYAQLLGMEEETESPEDRLRKKGIVFDTNII